MDGRWHLAACAWLGIATLWHGWPWLAGERIPPGDFAGYAAALQQVGDALLAAGRVPDWCPRCYAGASRFTSVWREVALAPLAWAAGPVLAVKLAFLAAKAAAGIGLYLLVVRAFAAPLAGIVAGHALAFGAVANHQLEHLDLALATALLPPTVWVALRLLRDGGLGRAVALGALAAVQLANHWVHALAVPLLVAVLALAGPWPGALAGVALLRDRRELRRRAGWILAALAVFAVLAASTLAWLTADAEHHRMFSEAATARQRLVYIERSPFLFLNRENVLAPWLAAHQPPGFDLPRTDAGRRYLGVVLLAACGVGLWLGARQGDPRWRRLAAGSAALFGVQYWLSLGPRTWLWEVATSLRVPETALAGMRGTLWTGSAALAVAAVFLAWRGSPRAARRAGVASLLVLAPAASLWNGLAWALPVFTAQRSPGHFFDTAAVWLCGLLALALVAIERRIPSPRAAGACLAAIGVALALDFAPSRARFAGGTPLDAAGRVDARVAALPGEGGTLRIGTPIAYRPSWSLLLARAEAGQAWGWLPWQAGRSWGDYYARALYAESGPRPDGRGPIEPDAELLAAARIRYLLAPEEISVPAPWHRLDVGDGLALWRGPEVAHWARAFRAIVWREQAAGRRAVDEASRALAADHLLVSPPHPGDDPRLAALRERAVSEPVDSAPPPFDVRWRREAAERIALEVDAGHAPAAIALSEGYHPWWRAEVDGRPAPVLRHSVALLAVPVGPGEHSVALRFRPPFAVRAAEVASGAGWLAVAGLAARAALARRRAASRRRD